MRGEQVESTDQSNEDATDGLPRLVVYLSEGPAVALLLAERVRGDEQREVGLCREGEQDTGSHSQDERVALSGVREQSVAVGVGFAGGGGPGSREDGTEQGWDGTHTPVIRWND